MFYTEGRLWFLSGCRLSRILQIYIYYLRTLQISLMSQELTDLLDKDKRSSDQINAKLDKLFKLEEEFNKKETALKKDIRKILNPEQQARLILFQLRFDKEMREMIQGIKGMRQERMKQREKRWR